VPAGFAQEELQRVGRRLERLGRRRGSLLGRRLGLCLALRLDEQLDAAPVELLIDRLRLERIELERLENLDQLYLPELAARLRGLEQRRQLLAGENRLDLDGCYRIPLIGARGRCSRLVKLPKHADPRLVKSNAR
jgi:hypothetical protein